MTSEVLTHGGRRKELGQRIRELRQRKKRSLRSFAAKIGVSAATMSAIENGHTGVNVDRLELIASELGVSPGALLTLEGLPRVVLSRSSESWKTFDHVKIDPVLAGAIAAFVETGYHGATMRAIAERAGMSVPGVYHHYTSKHDLLVRIFDMTMDELDWRIDAARAEGDEPLQRLALIVEALALFHTLRSDLAFIGSSEMRSLEQPDRDRIAARRSALQHAIDVEIDAALRNGTATTPMAREAGRAIATMCTSLPQWFRPGGSTTPESMAVECARLAVRMVGGEVR